MNLSCRQMYKHSRDVCIAPLVKKTLKTKRKVEELEGLVFSSHVRFRGVSDKQIFSFFKEFDDETPVYIK